MKILECKNCKESFPNLRKFWEWKNVRNSRNRTTCKSCINDIRLFKNTGMSRNDFNERKIAIIKEAKYSKTRKNKEFVLNLTDSYIAMTLGMKTNEIPIEIIEQKRLIIKLRRHIKNGK